MSIETPIASANNWFVGEDRIFRFTIKKPDGSIQDISGWAMKFDIRTAPSAVSTVLTKTTPAGINLVDPTNGVCEVTIQRADTIDGSGNILIQPGRYVYALYRTDAGAATDLAFGDAVLRLAASR